MCILTIEVVHTYVYAIVIWVIDTARNEGKYCKYHKCVHVHMCVYLFGKLS